MLSIYLSIYLDFSTSAKDEASGGGGAMIIVVGALVLAAVLAGIMFFKK